jgi:hypothetical protein
MFVSLVNSDPFAFPILVSVHYRECELVRPLQSITNVVSSARHVVCANWTWFHTVFNGIFVPELKPLRVFSQVGDVDLVLGSLSTILWILEQIVQRILLLDRQESFAS